MTAEELMFFDKMPQMFPVYRALKEHLENRYPEMRTKVSKTQISFSNRYVFAMASLPWRRVKNWPKQYLLVSFGLSYKKESPRIAESTEAYPNRWTHHVIAEREEDIDTELLGWLDEAYRFSKTK